MTLGGFVRRLVTGLLVAATLVGSLVGASPVTALASPRLAASQGGTFAALTPVRLLDTRTGNGGSAPGAGGTVALVVSGRGGVPWIGVAAVVLTVTAVVPKAAGYVVAYAAGTPRPTASNLNFSAGQTVANLVVVPVGAGGIVDLTNGSSTTTNLLADVSGYYLSGPPVVPGAFQAVAAHRVLDTRTGLGGITLAAHGTLVLPLTGSAGIPATGVSAVALNVTAVAPLTSGYLTVYPDGTARPLASAVSFVAGRTVASLVIVELGSAGAIDLYDGSSAQTGLVADVAGYFVGGSVTAVGAYAALPPTRALDTRAGPVVSPGAGGTVALQVTGRGGVPATGVAAVALTVTAVTPPGPGYVTAFADGSPRPVTSNVSFATGETTADLVLVPVGADGKVDLYNGAHGRTALVADVQGYVLDAVPTTPTWGAPVPVDPITGQAFVISCPTASACVAGDITGHALVSTAGTWSKPVLVDPGHGLDVLSCPSTTFCAAIDEVGNAVTYDGAHWSAPAPADTAGGYVDGLSCRSATFCVAVDTVGNSVTFNGSAWSQPLRVGQNGFAVNTVACVSTTWCLAVDNPGNSYVFDGTVWSAGTYYPGYQVTSVSCPTTHFCAAVDTGGGVQTYNGTTWKSAANYSDVNGFNSVSCSSTTYCVATDNFASSVTLSGGTWGAETQAGSVLTAISCPAGLDCYAVGGGDSVQTYDGSAWSTPVVFDATHGGAISVSCPTASFCALVDSQAEEMTYDGHAWTSPVVVGTGYPYPPTAISCASAAFCRAVTNYPVDFNGDLIAYDGSTWATTSDLDGSYKSISCPSSTFCAAGQDFGNVVIFDGTTWTAHYSGAQTPTGISCPSSGFCAVVDHYGVAVTFDGTSWGTPVQINTSASPGQPKVSCTSSSFCAAVDGNGTAFMYDGHTWSAGVSVDPGAVLASVSCSSTTNCLAVDDRGAVVTYDGSTWSTPNLIDSAGGGFVSVSCASDAFCVAVDAQGNALTRS